MQILLQMTWNGNKYHRSPLLLFICNKQCFVKVYQNILALRGTEVTTGKFEYAPNMTLSIPILLIFNNCMWLSKKTSLI